ncbi:MAG: hypothetical protein KDA61_06090 [Planctomycetales bacterium]|nr:hypothetical protein [Planctomycetales bacterium]
MRGDQLPEAWQSLDHFVCAAQNRGLNILMQAPVVGGNAGGPPPWAGRVASKKSAPLRMDALVDFAGKLARRYAPGGDLAREQGWGGVYGVRAWELDNEPESYRTHWDGQAKQYAQFAAGAALRIKSYDPHAVIVTAATAPGKAAGPWLDAALSAAEGALGVATDVVSFHNYEGLDTFFAGREMTVVDAWQQVYDAFERHEHQGDRRVYGHKTQYWHTEGNFDFLGLMSRPRRAAWRFQMMTRAFAAGISKVAVMDASPPEQIAVRTYIEALPDPFPMKPAEQLLSVGKGDVSAFRHLDGNEPADGAVWVVWARAGTGDAMATIPVVRESVEVFDVEGRRREAIAREGYVALALEGDDKMAPPLIVVDRPAPK